MELLDKLSIIALRIALVVSLIVWNIVTIMDIKETVKLNKDREYLGAKPKSLPKSAFWCIICDFCLIVNIVFLILGR